MNSNAKEKPERLSGILPTLPRRDEADRDAREAGETSLRPIILRLMAGESLDRTEAARFITALLDPAATDAQIGAALTALAMKGETVEELAGMAEAMRDRAIGLSCTHQKFIDTAGTGSSRAKTFNVSTAAAFVIAGAGLPVAKHGSRAATSRSGSADVLDALGVNTAAPPEVAQRCLNEQGICFLFAPLYHLATARVAHLRRELGMHTTFNLLGPLTNPARAPFQILGVWHRSLVEPVARALRLLGTRNSWVVHGADGLDEITLIGETYVGATRRSGEADETTPNDCVHTFTIEPRDFGFERQSLDGVRGGGPLENANLIRAVLQGEVRAEVTIARQLIVANAAAALHVGEMAPTLSAAAELAQESIASGRALARLEALVRETNRSP